MSGRARASEISLVAVGLGIRVVGQLTTEAIAWIRRADRVLYVVADEVAEATLKQLNPEGCESLLRFYREGRPRLETYEQMAERALSSLRTGALTCIALYGHPGYYAYPAHLAIRRAREEGFGTLMLPAISAEACLFADLGIDPATDGFQSYDATSFLVYRRKIDVTAGLVLWQVGLVGDPLYSAAGYDQSIMPSLVERLLEFYPADHVASIYEASILPGVDPSITPSEIGSLAEARLTTMSTLYVPPSESSIADESIWARIEELGRRGVPAPRGALPGPPGKSAGG